MGGTSATGVVALAARHVESGRVFRHRERHAFPSASLIKLPTLAAYAEAVDAGRIDPAERTRLGADDRVDGTGVLKALAPGLAPTWDDVATLMITVSDNVATNLLIDRLGMDAIGAWIRAAGLGETRLERRMMDHAAMRAGRSNWTSAGDMETLLTAVAAGTCVSAAAAGRRAGREQDGQLRGRDPRRRHPHVAGRHARDRGAHRGRARGLAGDGHDRAGGRGPRRRLSRLTGPPPADTLAPQKEVLPRGAAFDAALRYAREREAFGRRIAEHQAIAFTLAEMATGIEAATQMCRHAATLKGAHVPCIKEASMSKLFASRMCEHACSAAIQIHGGYGFVNDDPVEKYYRDARVFPLYDGTNEVQKILSSRELLAGR